jgi:hypothetical protein
LTLHDQGVINDEQYESQRRFHLDAKPHSALRALTHRDHCLQSSQFSVHSRNPSSGQGFVPINRHGEVVRGSAAGQEPLS